MSKIYFSIVLLVVGIAGFFFGYYTEPNINVNSVFISEENCETAWGNEVCFFDVFEFYECTDIMLEDESMFCVVNKTREGDKEIDDVKHLYIKGNGTEEGSIRATVNIENNSTTFQELVNKKWYTYSVDGNFYLHRSSGPARFLGEVTFSDENDLLVLGDEQ